MEPYNPYSPPRSPAEPKSPDARAHPSSRGMAIKWTYIGACALLFALSFGMTLPIDQSSVPMANALLKIIRGTLSIARIALTCVWIHMAWSAIPQSERRGRTPGEAVGMLFVPVMNLYWMFSISTQLCDILNARLARSGSTPFAPKGLAVLGCVVSLVMNVMIIPSLASVAPFVTLIAGGIWFTYMLECDKARGVLDRIALQE